MLCRTHSLAHLCLMHLEFGLGPRGLHASQVFSYSRDLTVVSFGALRRMTCRGPFRQDIETTPTMDPMEVVRLYDECDYGARWICEDPLHWACEKPDTITDAVEWGPIKGRCPQGNFH